MRVGQIRVEEEREVITTLAHPREALSFGFEGLLDNVGQYYI